MLSAVETDTLTALETALSLTGRPWVVKDADERLVAAFTRTHDLPDMLARILAARGVTLEEADVFLSPSLKNSLPDPSHLLDMDIAANRIASAISGSEKIAIFGDYDVDGATSSALLALYFESLGSKPLIYIPDRMVEGYGPNAKALLGLQQQGATLVITVDCGTMAFEPLQAAFDAGLDVIVADHHIGEARKPKAYAIVNPNRLDETSPHGQMAAVGVCFLLIVAVNRVLRQMGWFSSPARGASQVRTFPLEPILQNARELRKNMTDAESLLWSCLRMEQLGAKFRKQHPVGQYIADFACLEHKLIIELDGGQHDDEPARTKDAARTAFLEAQGFKVIRFWNHEMLQETQAILEKIHGLLQASPPPNHGGGVVEPDVRQWLDLVAVGTVCDVVPLTGVNRAYVAQGLKILASRKNTGLRTVLDMAAASGSPGVYACGFVIGPRINAGGRVGKADLGVRLLSTADEVEALMLARELEQHNAERKAIESMVLEQAMEQAEAMDASLPVMVVANKGWHPGVIGIVAGRLKERFHKPVAVIANIDGIGKASCRSVPGFDFGAAVIAAHASGILLGGGGHAMAAGFSIEEAKINELAAFFVKRLEGKAPTGIHKLTLDGIISIGGATIELLTEYERLGPFGQGNPSLRLMVQNVVNMRPEVVGEHHVKTLLIDRVSSARLSAIAFRVMGTQLGEALLSTRGKNVDIAGQLKIQEWNGRTSVSMTIEDIRLSQR